MPATMRVREATHSKLAELSIRTHRPIVDVLDVAVERYRREVLLESADRAYAAWRHEHSKDDDEQRVWDTTLQDGLTD